MGVIFQNLRPVRVNSECDKIQGNIQYNGVQLTFIVIITRKLSYRKDDRAMRPVYECPENFLESTMPTATFPEIFNGLSSD